MATPAKHARLKPAGRDQRRPASTSRQDGANRVSRASVARRSDSAQKSPPKTGAMRQIKASRPPLSAQDLLALYRPDLHQELLDSNAPLYRYGQVYEHLVNHPGVEFADATSIPGDLRSRLQVRGTSVLRETARRSSEDGTSKLLLAGSDGACIETVVMRYRQRVTACISTQVGCAVGCVFCATGGMGLTRNLTVAEIVDQARAVSALLHGEGRRLSNIVFMGMGEPLLNLQAVLTSIRVLTDPSGMNMSHRSLSISTVGIPAGIRRLADEEPQVNLAISLHAADDALRARLIPPKFRHSLTEILAAAWDHFELTHRKLLIEYVLLGDVNDSPEDARRLAALLKGHMVSVNLLVWNPVWRGPQPKSATAANRPTIPAADSGRADRPAGLLHAPTHQAVEAFRSILTSSRIETVVRQSKGGRIDAACGQLAGRLGSYSDKT